jgi:hypothetical protein
MNTLLAFTGTPTGQVPMHKLNWGARADYEYIGNYKVLQGCFDKLGIDRVGGRICIPVNSGT